MRALSSTARERARAQATAWLLNSKKDHGGMPLEIAESILDTLEDTPGLSPNVQSLRSMGRVGIEQLRTAVSATIAERKAKRAGKDEIALLIDIPRERAHFTLDAYEGQTMKDLTDESKELAEHMAMACGGIGACSTCHVIVHPDDYARLAPPDDAELDMLDLAAGVTPTSRLGCQLVLPPRGGGPDDDAVVRITLPDVVVDHYS